MICCNNITIKHKEKTGEVKQETHVTIRQLKTENKCRIDSKMTAQQEIKNQRKGLNAIQKKIKPI